MSIRLAALALVLTACACASLPEPEPKQSCGGVPYGEREPLPPEECPTVSPLRVNAGCPPTTHAATPDGECVAQPSTLVALSFDDPRTHPEEVRAAARLGLEQYNQGLYPDACERFAFAFERTAHVKYGVALASCRTAIGQNIDALELFRAVAAAKPPQQQSEKFAPLLEKSAFWLQKLRAQVGEVRIEVQGEGGALVGQAVEITLDHQRVSPELLATGMQMDASPHVVEAWARCYEPSELVFDVVGGQQRRLHRFAAPASHLQGPELLKQ